MCKLLNLSFKSIEQLYLVYFNTDKSVVTMREKSLILDEQGKIGQVCKIKERGKIFTGKIVTFGKTSLSAKMLCTLIFIFTFYSKQE